MFHFKQNWSAILKKINHGHKNGIAILGIKHNFRGKLEIDWLSKKFHPQKRGVLKMYRKAYIENWNDFLVGYFEAGDSLQKMT